MLLSHLCVCVGVVLILSVTDAIVLMCVDSDVLMGQWGILEFRYPIVGDSALLIFYLSEKTMPDYTGNDAVDT